MRCGAVFMGASWLVTTSCHPKSNVGGGEDSCVAAIGAPRLAKASVVYFRAVWSGPDQVFVPILMEALNEHPSVGLHKVDVDTAQAIAAACGVRAVPTLKGVRYGVVVSTLVGAVPKNRVNTFLDSLSSDRLPTGFRR
jgi:thioredoxin 1